jgi:hypothetical protein
LFGVLEVHVAKGNLTLSIGLVNLKLLITHDSSLGHWCVILIFFKAYEIIDA